MPPPPKLAALAVLLAGCTSAPPERVAMPAPPAPPVEVEPTPPSTPEEHNVLPDDTSTTRRLDDTALAGGEEFVCAIASRRVFCWGSNHYGQLGSGTLPAPGQTARAKRARPVAQLTDARAVVAGGFHACALHDSGAVACWGRNDYGQLGDGTTTTRTEPRLVADLEPVVELSAGGYHTCARNGRGAVWCWGSNHYGALATAGPDHLAQPHRVAGLDDAVQLAAGSRSQCALRRTGQVACWGDQSMGQLGDGVSGKGFTHQIRTVSGVDDAVQIVRNGFEGCVRRLGGAVWCWGWNLRGGVGDGTTEERSRPVQVAGVSDAVALWALGSAFCARNGLGATLCWGSNEYAGLGDGTRIDRLRPHRITAWDDGQPMDSAGLHSCIRRPSGAVECWGMNREGQLGNGHRQTMPRPTAVLGLPASPLASAGRDKPPFHAHIEQLGRRRTARAGVITLARRPFTVVLRFTGEPAALINASHDRTCHDLAKKGARMDDLPGFGETGIADHDFNPEQLLYVIDTAPNYWFWTSKTDHRFDAPCVTEGAATLCRRTIANLYYRGPGKVPLTQSRKPALFLVIAAQRDEDGPVGPTTVYRQALELRFR